MNGTIHWKYQTGAEIKSSPSVSFCNHMFVGSHDKHVYAIDVEVKYFWKFYTLPKFTYKNFNFINPFNNLCDVL